MFYNIQEILEYKKAIKELPQYLSNILISMVMEDRENNFFTWEDIYLLFISEHYDELIKINFLEEDIEC